MVLLVTKALPQVLELGRGDPRLGRLLTPRHYPRSADTAFLQIPWAADNDAYSGFDEPAFLTMLEAISGAPDCLFVSAPDVVGEALPTLRLYELWADRIRERGLPPALVAQDGLTPRTTPWDEIGALFIGGSDDWKCSPAAEALVREASEREVHVHAGRVNSIQRAKTFAAWGAQSMDGSMFSQWTNRWVPWFLERMPDGSQPSFDLGGAH